MFAIRNLAVLQYANAFTLWHYKAGADTVANVLAPNYFADASDMIAVGDMMLISAVDEGAHLYFTQSNHDSVIAVVMSQTPSPITA
jgi:hypothetical protein